MLGPLGPQGPSTKIALVQGPNSHHGYSIMYGGVLRPRYLRNWTLYIGGMVRLEAEARRKTGLCLLHLRSCGKILGDSADRKGSMWRYTLVKSKVPRYRVFRASRLRFSMAWGTAVEPMAAL